MIEVKNDSQFMVKYRSRSWNTRFRDEVCAICVIWLWQVL